MHVDDREDAWMAVEAEKSVLGAIVLDSIKAMGACIRLRPEHFGVSSHRTIFGVCARLLAANQRLDQLALKDALGADLDSVGGFSYIIDLSDGVYRNFDVTQRVDQIIEKWKLRRVRSICSEYQGRVEAGELSAETLADLQADVFDAIQESAEHDDPHVAAYSDAAFEDLIARCYSDDASGLGYGLSGLDSWTGGMRPGEVTIVGARSGVGKSSLMKQAAVTNALKGVPVVMFSLEMSRQEMLEGVWAIVSGVEARKVARPKLLLPAERSALEAAMRQVKECPLRIYDKAELDINQIVALARMNVRQFGAKLICVDYAQTVEAEGKDERTKVASVSKKLTKMAKSERCHVMLLSQLRKVPVEQNSKPPAAADLRETGQLENDAHVIVLLHRGWDEQSCRIMDDASIIIPEIRRGQTGAFDAFFNSKNLCFEPHHGLRAA